MTTNADLFANYATSTIAGGALGAGTSLGMSDTSLLLATGSGASFPSIASAGQFMLMLGTVSGAHELVMVTARASDTCTIVRGREGTAAQVWPVGTPVECVLTGGQIANLWLRVQTNPLNVRDYGAKGDGVTDDTAALLAAEAASVSGQGIYYPAGTYLTHSPIPVRDGRRHYGDSDQTWITQANGANLSSVFASYNWLNNVNQVNNPAFIYDLGIDGNDANNTSGHGIVLMGWQSVIRQVWIKHVPGDGVRVTDRCSDNTTLCTNSVVENKLYDLKIANTGANGIYVTDFNGQCTDGRIENCDINTTALTGMRVDRAAGWYITDNHLYSIIGSGYTLNKCFATWFCHNQIADFGNSASVAGTFSGVGITCIEGYPTVVADNIILCHEADASSSYTYLSVTMDGFLTATYGTYCIIHDNQIRGAYPTVTSVLSLGFNASASSQQQTSGQPAGILMHGNHFDRVHTLDSVGSYITANWLSYRVRGPSQLDGDVSLGGHILSTSAGGLTITAGASAGTSPPAPLVIAGHDARGDVQFGTGTAPSSGVMVHVAFASAYAAIPIVLISPVNGLSAALQLNVGTVTVNGFDLRAAVAPAASQAHTTYEFTYFVIQ